MVLKYRYIGKGITDNNGIAHITEDEDGQTCNGYTGTGKGLTQIVASTDDKDHISDSSLQSETYEVLDAQFYDSGIDGTANNIWQDSNNMISRGSDGTTLTGSTWSAIRLQKNSSVDISFTNGLCIEFDVLAFTGSARLNIKDASSHFIYWNSADSTGSTGHYKITLKDGKLYRQINDGTPTSENFDTTISTFALEFQAYTNFELFKFKEFKIYPI